MRHREHVQCENGAAGKRHVARSDHIGPYSSPKQLRGPVRYGKPIKMRATEIIAPFLPGPLNKQTTDVSKKMFTQNSFASKLFITHSVNGIARLYL